MRFSLCSIAAALATVVFFSAAHGQAPQGAPLVSDAARDYQALVDWATHGSSAGERLRRSAAEFAAAAQQFDRAVGARAGFDQARRDFGSVMTAWRHVLEALNAPEVTPGTQLRNRTRDIHQMLDQIRAQMNLRDPFIPY